MRASLTRRLTTTAAAALLAVLVPAAPVAGAQPSAQPPAQPSGEPPQETGSGPTPPPLGSDTAKPDDNGKPDVPYTPIADKSCVASLPSNVQLRTIPWGQSVLRFEDLRKFATGKGQTIAVIDTGVNRHDFLGGRLSGGGDYVVDGGDGLDDCDGHGTQVAGVIAANPGDKKIGFRGIAYDANIVSIRQSSKFFEYKPQDKPSTEHRPGAGSLSTLAKAVVRAADRDVDVINMSIDTCRSADRPISGPERELQRALRYAVEKQDVVVVSSAGNIPADFCPEQNNADPKHPKFIVSPPWFSEYVLSVAAVQQDGRAAEFSMNGPWVSVAAPGTQIISLDPGDKGRLVNVTMSDNGQRSAIQGTSFAAPYVAGLAALVRERFEKLGRPLRAAEVMERIRATATHPAAPDGHNSQVGHGMVNPIAALTTMIPAEEGIAPDEAIDIPFEMPPAHERDWTPVRVAVLGSGGGLGLLLLTLFIVHTVRRQRRDRVGSA
ncbi:MAG: type VII secretion-associated serine protease mycosin [Actinophytocola sp.]|uniref:type VII secretion-associated serine protease mycosin n=1 Tax=Actinophytocola sp. TaxID=1872138 RepID=UPI0013263C4A|nr:type VII secretion-associated serine protease mycosin [Actinophytocola sp.]MPZ85766.1 type VII secretion-associated serine protease mycosin [Actinophytocola sp.]